MVSSLLDVVKLTDKNIVYHSSFNYFASQSDNIWRVMDSNNSVTDEAGSNLCTEMFYFLILMLFNSVNNTVNELLVKYRMVV
jgi:hypothetical protein